MIKKILFALLTAGILPVAAQTDSGSVKVSESEKKLIQTPMQSGESGDTQVKILQTKQIAETLKTVTADSAKPVLSDDSSSSVTIGWGNHGDKKILVKVTDEGLELSSPDEDDGDDFEVQWDAPDSVFNNEKQENKGDVFSAALIPVKQLKFGKLNSQTKVGLSYHWSFASGSDDMKEIMNNYSLDILCGGNNIFSFVFGFGTVLQDHSFKWQAGYEYLFQLTDRYYIGTGLNAGYAFIKKDGKKKYDYYYGTRKIKGHKTDVVLCPKVTTGFKLKHFRIGIEESIDFIPDFINEIGVVIGFNR